LSVAAATGVMALPSSAIARCSSASIACISTGSLATGVELGAGLLPSAAGAAQASDVSASAASGSRRKSCVKSVIDDITVVAVIAGPGFLTEWFSS